MISSANIQKKSIENSVVFLYDSNEQPNRLQYSGLIVTKVRTVHWKPQPTADRNQRLQRERKHQDIVKKTDTQSQLDSHCSA